MNKLSFLFVASAFCVISCDKSDNQVLDFEPAQQKEEGLTQDELLALRNQGVNRLSFGVQSFDDTLLKRIGRIHNGVPGLINRNQGLKRPLYR